MNYIYYQTKTLFSNTGDVLINRSLITTLRTYGIIRANCASSIPPTFIEALGVRQEEKIEAKSEWAFLSHILKAAVAGNRVYIVSGLGHISGGGVKRMARNITACLLFMIYRLLRVNIVRIGFSIGGITKGLALTEFLRGCLVSDYYVRDTQSLSLCHSIGIKKAKLCPDMSWLYEGNGRRSYNLTIGGGKQNVLLNFRNRKWESRTLGGDDDPLTKQILGILDCMRKKMDFTIIIAYQVAADYHYSQYLAQLLGEMYEVEFVKGQMDLDGAEALYGRTTYVISNRLHSLLLCYKYGALPIGLVDRNENMKIVSTFKDCGLGNLLINIGDNDARLDAVLSDIIAGKMKHYDYLVAVERQKRMEILDCLNSIFYSR